jgi:HNH endonuclease
MAEIWAPVPTHAGYAVTENGRIRGPRRILRPMEGPLGHLYVLTPLPRRPRKLYVHRAVLLTFVGPPPTEEHEVRHLDGNPHNNDLSNLCWGTHTENMQDKQIHGTELFGEAKPGARLTLAQVLAIKADPRASRLVGAEYSVSHTTVLSIRRGTHWRRAA